MRLTNEEKDTIRQYAILNFKEINEKNSLEILRELMKISEDLKELTYSIHSKVVVIDLSIISELIFKVKEEFYPNFE